MRRNYIYTLPYTLIGLLAAFVSWYLFGSSQAELPFFALILFVLLGCYIFGLEVYYQIRSKFGPFTLKFGLFTLKFGPYNAVPFLESTRTLTAGVFLAAGGVCSFGLLVAVAFDLSSAAQCYVRV